MTVNNGLRDAMVNVMMNCDGDSGDDGNDDDEYDNASAPRLPSHSRSRSLDAGRKAILCIVGWQYNVHTYDVMNLTVTVMVTHD